MNLAFEEKYTKCRTTICRSVKQLVHEELQGWALYAPTDVVTVVPLDVGYSISYYTRAGTVSDRIEYACFDLNWCRSVMYLLHISIPPMQRGYGHGKDLYQRIENIARKLNCYELQQYASGWTLTRSRAQYLQSLGYTMRGTTAVKEFK